MEVVISGSGGEGWKAELEIAVGHWPFSDQFVPFGRANPIC